MIGQIAYKSALVAALVAGVGFLAVGQAKADTIYGFTITGSGISGSGAITLMATGTPGIDEITGIDGTFSTSTGAGFSGAITGLNPGSYSATSPTSDSLDHWDNLFYPSGSSPIDCPSSSAIGSGSGLLDYCGLDFIVAGAYEVNVFGNTGTSTGYQVSDGILGGTRKIDDGASVTFAASPVPEPSDFALIIVGFLGAAIIMLKRRYLKVSK